MKKVAGVISVLVVMPIWLYLVYRILDTIQAGELMWFLYWVYVPAAVLSRVIVELAAKD
jgi:hypothetical protein